MPAAARYPWPYLNGIHAVLIEDNEDTRAMVTQVLGHCGALVSVYESADAAIANIAEVLPSVVVSDLSMPGLDGLQFLRRLRALPPGRGGRTPAIAITAYREEFAAASALEAGFNAYLTKPIKLEGLCRLVKELSAGSSRRIPSPPRQVPPPPRQVPPPPRQAPVRGVHLPKITDNICAYAWGVGTSSGVLPVGRLHELHLCMQSGPHERHVCKVCGAPDSEVNACQRKTLAGGAAGGARA